MKKPRIIIADFDAEFITRLEFIISEAMEDTADIETITSADYFEEFFSFPENADVLVISESQFSNDIQRHNFKRTIVLTEHDDITSLGGFPAIYKYTSLDDICSQIMMTASDFSSQTRKKETVVSVICSASGGAGKSTVALGICRSLSIVSKKVLYINAQRINDFGIWLNAPDPIPNSVVSGFLTRTLDSSSILSNIRSEMGFDYFPPFSLALASLGLDCSVYLQIIDAAARSRKYDVIIVDTDTAFDEDMAELITRADKVLTVYNETRKSVFSTNSFLKNISYNDKEKYFFVCNNFRKSDADRKIAKNFSVNEYVCHFEKYDDMSLSDISNHKDIKKVSYLVL